MSGVTTMMKTFLRMTVLLGVVVALGMIAPQRGAADNDDPPSRVARLSYTHGEVSFEPGGTDEWVTAVVNRPITTGDKLWTDKDARAELHIGSAAIRLKGQTGFSFLNLTDNTVQIRLTEGTVGVHLRQLEQDETFEVDTPNLAFNLLRPGDYRLEVNEDGNATIVSIRGGEGEVTGGGQAFTIHANERATFTGTEQLLSDMDSLPDYDAFDNWCRDRERREERSESARYVSRDVVGYEDLDEYGYWRPAAEYGTIWYPRTVVVGWAPYRYGHWVWISPWGWTWVEDEPWGFAPFHYGRWVFVGGAWGWCPGPIAEVGVAYVRPVYAPALVAWVGGRHWGVGIGVGGGTGVAWVPLGPREVYVPSYHVSQTYVTNVNVTNTTVNNTTVTNVYNTTIVNNNIHNNIHNDVHVNNVRYVNMNAPGAVTATSQTAFTSAQPVSKNLVKVDAKAMASAQVSPAPTFAPAKQSVLGSGAPATVKPSAAVQAREVVAKTAPPPPPPSFAKQQEVIHQNGGRPPAVSQMRQMPPERAQVVPVKMAPPAKPAAPQNAVGNRPGQPETPIRASQPAANRPGQPAAVHQPGKPPSEAQPIPNKPNREDRPASGQPETPNHASQPPVVNQPAKLPAETPAAASKPYHDDRPPSAQPVNRPQPPENARSNESNRSNNSGGPGNNRNAEVNPNRPANSDRQMQLEQKHQQEQQRLQQQQEQERQQLEQKHQQQLQRAQQQTENARQQQEHQQLQQRHDQQRQQMEQKHQQEQQKVQQQETKKQEKEQKRPDHPPAH